MASVILECNGKTKKLADVGDGPIDAAFKVIDRITKVRGKLLNFSITAIAPSSRAEGEANLLVEFNGRHKSFSAKAKDKDVILASIRAYLVAVNAFLASK